MGHLYQKKDKNGNPIGPVMMKYYRNGRAIFESSRTKNRTEAKKIMRKKESDIDQGVPVTAKIGKLRVDEALADVITDYELNKYDSIDDAQRRIDLHLLKFFGGRRMATISKADILDYIKWRKAQPIVTGTGKDRKSRKPSNGQINRELSILRRAFNLALENGKLLYAPYIAELEEHNVRKGFFERDQFDAVMAQLPDFLKPVIEFAYITGWRIDSEVLTRDWRNVDFEACEVRLEPGETKNGEGRTFPFTTELYRVLQTLKDRHDEWVKAGTLCPAVFVREVAKGRGGPKTPRRIKRFEKTWRKACEAAGIKRIPHDFRRTACRNLVRAGVPQSVAKKLTGHLTDEVFKRYDIVSPGDLSDAITRYDGAQERAKKGTTK